MFRTGLIAAVCLLLAACTTTNTRTDTAQAITRPTPGYKVLLVQPDIELAVLTAGGLQEVRADWSTDARTHITNSLQTALQGRQLTLQTLDPSTSMEGRIGQLLRLHEAVGASILANDYVGYRLPTHAEGFDWTLGEGARVLRDAYSADYALFVFGRGSYASDGRKAAMVIGAIVGVSVTLGGQSAFASLVDLRTGRIVWFNLAVAAPQADMRTAPGSALLVTSLLEDAPL